MKIPWQQLSDTALTGLIEEFVSREGTEYGEAEVSLQQKVNQVLEQLRRGEIEITFDPETGGTSLVQKS